MVEPRLGFGPRTYGLQSRRSDQAELPGHFATSFCHVPIMFCLSRRYRAFGSFGIVMSNFFMCRCIIQSCRGGSAVVRCPDGQVQALDS